jgi:predicted naringenin-chalcone synthase
VQRYHLGFMGCYAALPALRTAKQFCEADAAAVVLVVSPNCAHCTCARRTTPTRSSRRRSSPTGAAAGIVTSRPIADGERAFDLDRFETRITPNGEDDMAWKIGDHGFEMVLSNAIPTIIDDHITGAIEPLLDHDPVLVDALAADAASTAIEHWAIHPGGRSILDKVEVAPPAHRGAARARP